MHRFLCLALVFEKEKAQENAKLEVRDNTDLHTALFLFRILLFSCWRAKMEAVRYRCSGLLRHDYTALHCVQRAKAHLRVYSSIQQGLEFVFSFFLSVSSGRLQLYTNARVRGRCVDSAGCLIVLLFVFFFFCYASMSSFRLPYHT